jgi:hypothetical protein
MNIRTKGPSHDERLQTFLTHIHSVEQSKRQALYEIMDMVPFRDLETALMIATMES